MTTNLLVNTGVSFVTIDARAEFNATNLRLNVVAPTISSTSSFSLDGTIGILPNIYLSITPLPTAALDPFHDPVWVAIEFDLFDENDDPITVRIGNRGIITRTVAGVEYQYLPRLTSIPVELGTTITVTSYGSPVRGQPNGGLIKFQIDSQIWEWFLYRWIGQVFRVYFGKSVDPIQTDVDVDLDLVYVGRVASFKHDTLEVSVETTDETIQWDNPLITDFYDNTFPVALRAKPKPQLWGYCYSIEPQIENEASQIYAISYRTGGLDFISEVRVGGIPWNLNDTGPPLQGEWTPDLTNGKFTLGSPPLGFDVRCDARQGTFTVAGLITNMVVAAGGQVNANSMAELDNKMPGEVGFVTTTTPVNRLDAIDEFVTSAGCWWAVDPLGKAIAGVIDVPDVFASYLLDRTNIKTLELTTVHPPAWRIRVGYQKNQSPETSFASSVLQTTQALYKANSKILEPHYDNNPVLALEPRAVDVPTLDSSLVAQNSANQVQTRLITAWGTIRSLFNVSVFVLPDDIKLYDTVAVDYMMVSGNFRITSAIRAIGGGPATLQLWGTIGPFALQPPVLPPTDVTNMGIWTRSSGSGTFTVGVDTPPTVKSLWIRGVGGGGGGANWNLTPSDADVIYGGGGGAGGYFEEFLTVTSGSSFGWSVGAGGVGISGANQGQGAQGGSTGFGSANATGGQGGIATVPLSVQGGNGGFGSGATVIAEGGPGGNGFSLSAAVYQTFPFELYTANGGASAFGGGSAASLGYNQRGAPGSGGGGHASSVTNAPAMAGQNGLVIVIWFE